jgi:hypothetical protein
MGTRSLLHPIIPVTCDGENMMTKWSFRLRLYFDDGEGALVSEVDILQARSSLIGPDR